jgi:hypothetical protein
LPIRGDALEKKTHPKKTSLRPARRRLPTADGGRPRTDPAADTAPPSRQGRVLPYLLTVTGRAASHQRQRARTAPSHRTSTAPRRQTLSRLLPTGSAVPTIYWRLHTPSPAGTQALGRRRPPANRAAGRPRTSIATVRRRHGALSPSTGISFTMSDASLEHPPRREPLLLPRAIVGSLSFSDSCAATRLAAGTVVCCHYAMNFPGAPC